jgi:hypothetical protein
MMMIWNSSLPSSSKHISRILSFGALNFWLLWRNCQEESEMWGKIYIWLHKQESSWENLLVSIFLDCFEPLETFWCFMELLSNSDSSYPYPLLKGRFFLLDWNLTILKAEQYLSSLFKGRCGLLWSLPAWGKNPYLSEMPLPMII